MSLQSRSVWNQESNGNNNDIGKKNITINRNTDDSPTSNTVSSDWFKVQDTESGRCYYANRRTRMTLGKKVGYIDPNTRESDEVVRPAREDVLNQKKRNTTSDETVPIATPPSRWQRMINRTTGRYFYIDHVNKITTWECPVDYRESYFHDDSPAKTPTPTPANPNPLSDSDILTRHKNKPNFFKTSQLSFSSHPTDFSSQLYKKAPQTSPISDSNVHSSPSFLNDFVGVDSCSTIFDSANINHMIPSFQVRMIPDHLRDACPSCHILLSKPLKRRHHCRVCGDIFCDTCSPHKILPILPGEEYDEDRSKKSPVPVRVCTDCYTYCSHDPESTEQYRSSIRPFLLPVLLYRPTQDSPQQHQRPSYKSSNSSSQPSRNKWSISTFGKAEMGIPITTEAIQIQLVVASLIAIARELESILYQHASPIPAFTRLLTLPTTSSMNDSTRRTTVTTDSHSSITPSVLITALTRYLIPIQ